MKRIKTILIAGCTTLLLSQCASQDEVRTLNNQLRAVNLKVEEVQSSTANQMQKRTANSVNKIDTLAEQTRQLRAVNEENSQAFAQYQQQTNERFAALQAAIEQMRTQNEARLATLEQEFNQLTGNLKQASMARVQAAEKRARAAAKRAEDARRKTVIAADSHPGGNITLHPDSKKIRVSSGSPTHKAARQPELRATAAVQPAAAVPSPAKQPVIDAAPVVPSAGTALLNQAMASFKAGQYQTAYKTFEQVLAAKPKGADAARTLFYMGECLFNLGEYDLAILDYQKVISNYGKDVHSPAALLRQGMSFEKLTDLETAKIIYAKLMNDYPESREANTAKQRSKNL